MVNFIWGRVGLIREIGMFNPRVNRDSWLFYTEGNILKKLALKMHISNALKNRFRLPILTSSSEQQLRLQLPSLLIQFGTGFSQNIAEVNASMMPTILLHNWSRVLAQGKFV